ncbi:hypothetical protein Hdeb2414_s0014g00424991 [Helianthus debilis subsp. tardiflorus]
MKTPEKKGVVITDPPEPAQKRPKVTIKPFKAAGVEAEKEKEKEKKAAEKPAGKSAKKEKETTSGMPTGDAPKGTGTATDTARDKAHGPEVVHITGLDQLYHEKRKEPEIEKITQTVQPDAPHHSIKVTSSTGGSGSHAAGGASSGGAAGYMPQNIGPKDTLRDIYYKTYTEEARGSAPHQAP